MIVQKTRKGCLSVIFAILLFMVTTCAPAFEPAGAVLAIPVTLTAAPDRLDAATASASTETLSSEATAHKPEGTESPEPTDTGRQVQFEEQIAAVEFALPLTIQHLSPTAAWLIFELESPVAGEVFYWVDGKKALGVSSIEFNAAEQRHIIQLQNLLPDTNYRVRVGLPTESGSYRSPGLNGETWGVTLLRTFPAELEHLRVMVIGDSGFGESITYALTAQMAARQPDFVIHTGDVVYSAYENGSALRAYQAKYFWPFQKLLLQAPVYAVPGNHEYYDDAVVAGVPYYFYVFPPLQGFVEDDTWTGSDRVFRNWFAVRLMGYQFLFLESQRFYRAEDVSEQTEWMRQLLAEHDGPNVPVYHIATYTSGRHERDGLPIQQRWVPYFRETDTVLVLNGHDHNYERLIIDGIEYVVSGGGSQKLYGLDQPLEGSQVFAAESHFVLLDFYRDRIELESINAFGDVIDRRTLEIEP